MNVLYTETDFQEFLGNEKKVYLYGAGTIGGLVARRLKHYQIPICGYIETQPATGRKDGLPIVSIESIQDEEDLCIIIATTSKFQQEILDNLAGYKKIFILSNLLIRSMKMIDEKKLQFQTHLVEHCNLNCRGCYHFSPLAKEEYLSIEEYENDIKRLSVLFEGRMERILLLGGEPLLHPQLSDFFRITRKFFPKGSIQVLTNGILLLQMKKEFYHTLRECMVELWVTKYPVNFDYDEAEKNANQYGVKLNYFSHEPVRTLGHQPLDITGGQDGFRNFIQCYRANECIDLKQGKMYSCIIPAEIKAFCEYYKLDIPVTERDYVDIYKVDTAEELLKALGNPIPFCRYCNREAVEVFGVSPWEKTKYKIEEWTR